MVRESSSAGSSDEIPPKSLKKRVHDRLIHGCSESVLVPEVVNHQSGGAASSVGDDPNGNGETLGAEEAKCCLSDLGPGAQFRILDSR